MQSWGMWNWYDMDTLGLSNYHIVPFNSRGLKLSNQSYIPVHLVLRVLLHTAHCNHINLVSFLCQELQIVVKNSANWRATKQAYTRKRLSCTGYRAICSLTIALLCQVWIFFVSRITDPYVSFNLIQWENQHFECLILH